MLVQTVAARFITQLYVIGWPRRLTVDWTKRGHPSDKRNNLAAHHRDATRAGAVHVGGLAGGRYCRAAGVKAQARSGPADPVQHRVRQRRQRRSWAQRNSAASSVRRPRGFQPGIRRRRQRVLYGDHARELCASLIL